MRVRPSAGWYLIPVLMWIACIVIAVVAFKPVYDIFQAGLTQVGNGQRINVPAAGLTVYSGNTSAQRDCTLTDRQGRATTLEQFAADTHFDIDPSGRPRVRALASTPDGFAGGSYILQCGGHRSQVPLAVGDRIDVEALGKRIAFGILVPLALGVVGLVIVIVLLVRRHNSKSRIRSARAQAASGFPAGWSADSGYPPPPGAGSHPPPAS